MEKPQQPFADEPLEGSLVLELGPALLAPFMLQLTWHFNSRRNHMLRHM